MEPATALAWHIASLLLACALAVDSLFASAAIQLSAPPRRKNLTAAAFSVAQGGAYCMGRVLVSWPALRESLSTWARWISMVVFTILGVKLALEHRPTVARVSVGTVLALAAATSVDALAAGATDALAEPALLRWATRGAMVGLVTFVASRGALAVGSRVSPASERRTRLLGGLLLIGIGMHTALS